MFAYNNIILDTKQIHKSQCIYEFVNMENLPAALAFKAKIIRTI